MYPTIVVHQPQPNDIVGAPVLVAGLATGFEGTAHARVRDGDGHQLALGFFTAGGWGRIAPFQTRLDLPARPGTPNGFVEVFEDNPGYPDEGPYQGPSAELQKVIVPVVFGSHLVDNYIGFTYHVVVDGDTLSGIAEIEYGDGARWPAIFEANRDQVGDPDLIFGGQRLRIPHGSPTATTVVDVYFVDTEAYATGTYPFIQPVPRTVSAITPATGALDALFRGPSAAERAAGLDVWRSEATGFADLTIGDGIARVRLTGGCSSQGATFTVADLIIPTLKQFPTVDHVKVYSPDGETGTPDGPYDSIPACLNP